MRDNFGLVPDAIKANIEREEMVDDHLDAAKALSHALRQLDDRLSLVWAKENARPTMGLKPARWNIRRKNDPPAPDTYYPVETPDGGYREPDFGVLAEMQARDTWNRDGLLPEIKRGERNGFPYHYVEEDPAKERGRQREQEQRRDEMKSDFEAAKRVAGEGGLTKKRWGRG